MSFQKVSSKLFLFVIVLSAEAKLSSNEENVCLKTETYNETIMAEKNIPKVIPELKWCWVPSKAFRCLNNKVVMERVKVPQIVNRTRLVLECCEGYEEYQMTMGISKCVPICMNECVHGECIAPNTCLCESGFHGISCNEGCPLGHWGRNCSEKCNCSKEVNCGNRNEDCVCQPDSHGYKCTLSCGVDYNELLAATKPKCPVDRACNPETGACLPDTVAGDDIVAEMSENQEESIIGKNNNSHNKDSNTILFTTTTEKVMTWPLTEFFEGTISEGKLKLLATTTEFVAQTTTEEILEMSTTKEVSEVSVREKISESPTTAEVSDSSTTDESVSDRFPILSTAKTSTECVTMDKRITTAENYYYSDDLDGTTENRETDIFSNEQFNSVSNELSTAERMDGITFNSIRSTEISSTPEAAKEKVIDATMNYTTESPSTIITAMESSYARENHFYVTQINSGTSEKQKTDSTNDRSRYSGSNFKNNKKKLANGTREEKSDGSPVTDSIGTLSVTNQTDPEDCLTEINEMNFSALEFRFLPSFILLSGVSVLIVIIGARWMIYKHSKNMRKEKEEKLFRSMQRRKYQDNVFTVNIIPDDSLYLYEVNIREKTPVLQTFKPLEAVKETKLTPKNGVSTKETVAIPGVTWR